MAPLTPSQSYPLARGVRAAARLNLQHYLWRSTFGYLLHPDIPLNQRIKVADVGTGTGVWLLDLAEQLDPDADASGGGARLDGLDVDLTQAPHPAWLPPGVSMRMFDVYDDRMLNDDDVNGDMIGRYDIVHVRFFICVVKDGDPTGLLATFTRMLKPGGWLQWVEMDLQTLHVASAPGSERVEHTLALKNLASAPTAQWPAEKQYWTSRLASLMTKAGFVDVKEDRRQRAPWRRSQYHDVTLLAMDEMSSRLPGRATFDTVQNASREFEEGKRGVCLSADSLCVVGRKPINDQ